MTVKQILISFVVLFMVAVPGTGFCQNKVVVIPLMGKPAKNLHNVVTVAKMNGDFTDPIAAIDSITDASADNPYLLVIGPGVYDIGTTPLVMKPYVNISGSGQEVTVITGELPLQGSSGTGVVLGADHSALTDLTVKSTGGLNSSVAIYNYSASLRLERVTVDVSGGIGCIGIHNDHSSPIMTDVSVNVHCPTLVAVGVRNDYSDSIMRNVTSIASGADHSVGVSNDFSSFKMYDVIAVAQGESSAIGVHILNSEPELINVEATATSTVENDFMRSCGIDISYSAPVMHQVRAVASGGQKSYGMCFIATSSPFIHNSTMNGVGGGLYIRAEAGDSRVVNSKIVGGVVDESPDTQCRGNYDENLNNVDC